MGTDEKTFGDDLEKVCKNLFGDRFVGIFASDEEYPEEGGLCIVNVDKKSEPGSHWIAIADGLYYDSFQRDSEELIDNELCEAKVSKGIVQDVKENDCGQRCIAFLCVYYYHGCEEVLLL